MLKNIATLTLICASSAALAEGEPIVRDRLVYTSNDYVSVIASGVFPDNGRGTDNIGGGIAFMYGNQFHELLSVEGRVAFQLFETGRGKGSDFYQVQGGVDLTVTPWDRRDERPITPFALMVSERTVTTWRSTAAGRFQLCLQRRRRFRHRAGVPQHPHSRRSPLHVLDLQKRLWRSECRPRL